MTRNDLLMRLSALAVLLVPVALGAMWLASMLPQSPPAPRSWQADPASADPPRQTVPHLAQLPWKRDADAPTPVTVAEARVPWRRDAENPQPIWLAQAKVPFH